MAELGDMLEEPADGAAWWFCGWIGVCVSHRSIEFWWRSVPLWPKTVITAVTNWTRRRSVSLMPALLRRLYHWSVAASERHILTPGWTKMRRRWPRRAASGSLEQDTERSCAWSFKGLGFKWVASDTQRGGGRPGSAEVCSTRWSLSEGVGDPVSRVGSAS